MKNLTKTFSLMLIAVILCISSFTSVFAKANIPGATTDFYVNDFANIFTDEEKSSLMKNAVNLASQSDGVQVVISTVKSLEGDTVENYALNMYNKYGIGKDDMGLLILLSTSDRQIRVEVGRAMEAYINDAKAGRFIDKYAIPYLKDNKFNEGLINLQSAFIKEITDCMSSEKNETSTSNTLPSFNFSIFLGVLGIILLLVLLFYIIYLINKKIKKRKNLIVSLNNEIEKLKKEKDKLKAKHDNEKTELNKAIGTLQHDKNSFESALSKTQNELAILKDRYSRIIVIYPDADEKVNEMIKKEQIERDKKIAEEVDNHISDIIDLSPDKDIVGRVFSVMSEYKNLTHEQRSYIKNDFKKLKDLYINSLELKEEYEKKLEEERIRKLTEERKNKAGSVTKEILAVISAIGIARAHDLYKLNDAKDLYEDLDSETQKYVDSSVISKLNSLISAAKRDKDDEEHRRRQSSYSSSYRTSSSISRGGSFGGFGGRSGGGGASRGF